MVLSELTAEYYNLEDSYRQIVCFTLVFLFVGISFVLRGSTKSFLKGFVKNFFITIFVSFSFFMFVVYPDHNKEIEIWKEKVQTTYVEDLPITEHEIIDYLVKEGERTSDSTQFFTYPVKDYNVVSVVLVKENVKTKEEYVVEIVKVKDLESPYLEYQELKEKITSHIPKGYYNAKLYIAE